MFIAGSGSQNNVPWLKVQWLTGLWIQEAHQIDAAVLVQRELEAALEVDLQTPVPVLGGEQAQHALWFDDLLIDAGNRSVP